ncbi:LPS-assembly protein LptD [Lysobacter soyae]|uniref:LPS-assembly protein LptD n=1 Tax=Lysobacter soyae TaxID=2764185 RepID=A0ABX8WRP8_9GAMM|nr:LPS-assembly protein LptD [Lysobacter sp. CJ11]QYR53498.1 LPS-assembly protein LptD [Lysobacter sp. CJ11]
MNPRVRLSIRLLPLTLAIWTALPAHAEDKMPISWKRCPIVDPVPAFTDTQPTGDDTKVKRNTLPTTVEGDEQTGTIDIPVFSGAVNLNRGNQFLGTDKLTFNKNDNTYVAEGHVRYQDGNMRVVAEKAHGNQDTDEHTIEDMRYQLVSRRGNGTADTINIKDDLGQMYGATYSTCPPEARHWQLEAREIDINNEEGMGIARGAKLRIGRIPVLYMPLFVFPVDGRRRTGLLYPSISTTGRNGLDYKQPIYLNLAPNYDMTLYPRIMSKRGASLGTEFRYLNATGEGTIAGTYMPNDKLRDMSRGSFVFNGYQNLSQHWQARAGLVWLSDTRYLEDFNNSSAGIANYNVLSSVGIYGNGRYWNAGIMADRYQLADYTLTNASLPYDRLPRLYLNWDQPVGSLFRAGIEAEAVRFSHQSYRPILAGGALGASTDIPGGSRLDLKPFVSMEIERDAWYLRPTVAWRYTAYQLDGQLADRIALDNANAYAATTGTAVTPALVAQYRQANPTRTTPIFSVDTGLYFDRAFKFRDTEYTQTLEPRLFYLRVPYKDQNALPIFDTNALSFSWGQLFRDNRYSSADRQADANQLTAAISSRVLRQSDGHEVLNVSFGQIHYLSDARVHLPWEKTIEKGSSAYVADANWSPNDKWQFGASMQWDPKIKRRDLASVRGRYLFGDGGIVNLAYRYRRDLLEQADFSFVYPINDAWSLVGRHYYSLKDNKPIETLGGVQFDSCCIAIRVVARRYIATREGDLKNGIMLEFELKGLGSAGQDTKRTLRRAILGYHRDDLYLIPPETATGQTVSDPDPTTLP